MSKELTRVQIELRLFIYLDFLESIELEGRDWIKTVIVHDLEILLQSKQ